MRRLLARLLSWLPPSLSLRALVAAIRRLLLGTGWQHANAIAVLLLKLRPLLFCALYAAGQKWAAWATCIACDVTAIKLVRFAVIVGPMTSIVAAELLTAAPVLLMLVACKIQKPRLLCMQLVQNGNGTCSEIRFTTQP
jgi:hypothetical protein